ISYKLDNSKLSATKLDTLLTCKRKFYFKYICKLEEPKNILTFSNATFGLKIHEILEKVFKEDKRFDDAKVLVRKIKKNLEENYLNEIEEFNWEIWIETLKKFAQNEVFRYKDGYRLYDTEVWLEQKFAGFKICGKLDRIDIKDEKLQVIDYKSGNIDKLLRQKPENMTNFQLEFYYLLANNIKEVNEVSYYNLKDGKLYHESNLEEKIEKLKSTLNSLREPITTFELCEKQSNCIYCPYKKLCLREI
ncbi:MAG: PD-(D/E)XK nuclease family protein, partial [Epsilonproteobacteria bacterium]|nr:PD-(D/E)XK nuclease family protein [Campylobacterota bacterium]